MQLPTINESLPPIRYVQIQTHSRCNADCVFCPYIESAHAASPGVMTDETWRRVIECLLPFAAGINQGKVCPYLMQEPLIDKTIFDKIADIYRAFPGTLVEVSTNGAALTDKTVDRLFEQFSGRRHEIWVSHHGIDAATLQHVMKIDYAKATANLINLLKKSDGRFNIRIRGAGESRDGTRKYFTRKQYRRYWQEQFRRHGINTTNVDIDAFTFHDRAGSLHRVDRDACKLNFGKVREIGPGHSPFFCKRVTEWVHIMWDGSLRLCCMDYHHEVKLPSLKDMTLVDYFRSDAYAQLAAQVTGSIESPDNFICKRCISPGG
jgi:molybdenum cofactor biosynthesis enzyme MoaA